MAILVRTRRLQPEAFAVRSRSEVERGELRAGDLVNLIKLHAEGTREGYCPAIVVNETRYGTAASDTSAKVRHDIEVLPLGGPYIGKVKLVAPEEIARKSEYPANMDLENRIPRILDDTVRSMAARGIKISSRKAIEERAAEPGDFIAIGSGSGTRVAIYMGTDTDGMPYAIPVTGPGVGKIIGVKLEEISNRPAPDVVPRLRRAIIPGMRYSLTPTESNVG